ncbi:MAG: DUF2442 domain-containing protein [Phycisphaerales bacterium]
MHKDIIHVVPLDGLRLALTFEGGERRVADIGALVRAEGVFSEIANPAFFRSVRVNPESGTIEWPGGADLCPDVLYEVSVPAAADAA